MGVFGDWAYKYYEIGMNIIPITTDKKPPKLSWQHWQSKKQTPEDIDSLIERFGHCEGIALICGPVSGLTLFDYDYKYDPIVSTISQKEHKKDYDKIDKIIKEAIPPITLQKVGKNGWSTFYKYHPSHRHLQPNRNGTRLFDFKVNGYVVVAPSFHSKDEKGNDLFYKNTIGSFEDFQDLQEIDFDIVRELAIIFSTGGNFWEQAKGNRHGRIFSYGFDLAKVEKDPVKLGKLLIEYDLKTNGDDKKGPYFKDKIHVPQHSVEQFAVKWAERIVKSNTKIVSHNKKSASDDAWNYFIESQFYDIRKDILSGHVMIKARDNNDEWVDLKTIDGTLRSYAVSQGLPPARVKDELDRYVFEKVETKFLIDFPEWDGVDRIDLISNYLYSDIYSHKDISEMIKNWGVTMFLRIENPMVRNRVLVIQGEQNKGKDWLVQNLFSFFQPYYQQFVPPKEKKDFLEIISRLFIAHIEEWDQTKSQDPAFMKSMITASSQFFRESYGKAPTKRKTPISFIATVNPKTFLKDETGNTRFMILPLKVIDFGYSKYADSSQILSQLLKLSKNGAYPLGLELESKIKNIADQGTPESTEEFIEDLWKEMSSRSSIINPHLTQLEAANIINEIAKYSGRGPKSVRTFLKSLGYQDQVGEGRERVWLKNLPRN